MFRGGVIPSDEVIGIETVEIQLQRHVVGMNFGMTTPTHSLNFVSSSYTDMYMIDHRDERMCWCS